MTRTIEGGGRWRARSPAALVALVAILVPLPVATAQLVPSSQPTDLGDPASQAQETASETIVGIRFHGNYSIADAELLAAIGVNVGDSLDEKTLELIALRLKEHERVGSVDIRKRYRSLTRTDQVVLLIVIEERVPVREKWMFFPVFNWTDEYGVTFGARFTTVDLLGAGERISFPLTWGGERRAAAELTLDVDKAALTRVEGGIDLFRRKNPHFEIDDTRVRVWGEALKRVGVFETGGTVGWADVDFGDLREQQLTYGVFARLDTRQEVNLPRNAFYIGAGWDRLEIFDRDVGFNRYTVDLRGFKSFIGRSVIAAQAYYRGADDRLPDYERPFLGGAQTLRGYDAGAFIGDNLVTASVELRVPITPPVPVGLVGVDFFFDTGTVYDHGTKLSQAKFRHGVGGGVFFFIAFVGLKVDVGYDLDDSVKFHFSTGFRF